MIAWLKRILALIVSERVAELEHQLTDRKFAMHMAEHRIHDLELALADCRQAPAAAQDPGTW